MNRNRLIRGCLTLITLGLAQMAQAALVYDNGAPSVGPDGILGLNIGFSRTADDFTLSNAATLTNATAWTCPCGTGNVSWAIYNDNSGQLGAVLASGTSVSSSVPDGMQGNSPQFRLDWNLGSVALAAGKYWFEIHHGTSLTDSSHLSAFWSATNANDTAYALISPDPNAGVPPSSPSSVQVAFRLYGEGSAVPEPTSLLLCSLGLAALGATRRRQSS